MTLLVSSVPMQSNERLEKLGIAIPSIMIPRSGIDLSKWAVIACDQHTSEPEYWREVESIVADAPSTLRLVLPEVYLEAGDAKGRIDDIRAHMRDYVDSGILHSPGPGFVRVRRRTPKVSKREGLLVAIDLEQYEFEPGSDAPIQASERTILERLPPRVEIRRGAPLELPHVLVLYNDPDRELAMVLDSVDQRRLYETELMLDGGAVSGALIESEEAIERICATLEALTGAHGRPLLLVGDGNHSLAAAKKLWEELRPNVAPGHPARYALVELVNLYDPGLRFEPIHRIVSGIKPETLVAWLTAELEASRVDLPADAPDAEIADALGPRPAVAFADAERVAVLELPERGELPVASLQGLLNQLVAAHEATVDYIHGIATVRELASSNDRTALIAPEFDPALLYPTVRQRGVLPRKAFSLGDAQEKRYYLEVRSIVSD